MDLSFNKILIYFFTSIILSYSIIKILIRYSKNLNLIDTPNYRKFHENETPLVGGLGIILTFFLIFFTSWLLNWHLIYLPLNDIFLIIIGSVIIVLTGLIDDLKGLASKDKFLFQLISSLIVVIGISKFQNINWPLSEFFNYNIYFSSFITIFYIIGILNAINLIDGLDGLAGGVSIIITITFLGLSLLSGLKVHELYPAIILIGCLFGFLIHNKPPAKTFLGDTGSLFLGWFFAIYSLTYAQKTTFSLSILIPMMILGLPAFDVLFVMIKRFSSRHNYKIKDRFLFVFEADNNHLHHILLSSGISKKRTLILLYLLSVLISVIALFSFFNREIINLLYSVIFILVIIFLIRFIFSLRIKNE